MARPALLISKSKYLAGLQCDRLLWTYYNARNEIPPPGKATQAIFDQGHLVGHEARKLFPDGVEVEASYTDIAGTIDQSVEALKSRRPVFEGALSYNGAYARADILAPAPKSAWDVIEVKSSTEVKPVNLEDVAFQRYVYEGAGLNIRKCYVCHINNQYERDGEIEPDELFTRQDVTAEAEEPLSRVPENLRRMVRVISAKRRPETAIGPHCSDPYECPLYEKCHEHLPPHNVLTLVRMGVKGYDLINGGILDIKKLPASMKLSGAQAIQVDAVRLGKPFISRKEITEFLGGLEYPLYFLDFETIQPAIPLYDGSRPYQQVPFQFSLHVQERKGGKVKYFGFLGDGRSDPRPGLLRQLKPLLGASGSIVAYNAPFEQRCLRELAGAFKSYESWWNRLEPRFVDLLAPFRAFHYYHPKQFGSASIKMVLPALCGSGYEGYAIAEGGEASQAYLDLTMGKLSAEEVRKVRTDLERYCGRDTEAMVQIVENLGELIHPLDPPGKACVVL